MIDLVPNERNPQILLGKVGPLRVHVTLLDEDCSVDGDVEWYVTASDDRGDWRGALLEGYADSLAEAKAHIMTDLASLRESLNDALGTAR